MVSLHRERELKYELESELDLRLLGGTSLPERVFTSVYYDSEDRALSAAGLTLRRRLEHGVNTWQLKVPDDDARVELEAAGGPGGLPPELEALLRPQLGSRRVVEVATLKTKRTGRRVEGVEVTFDEVQVLEGQHVLSRFAELEAEATDESADLDHVDRMLRDAGATLTDQTAKISRFVAPAKTPKPGKKVSALARVQARFHELRQAILAADIRLRIRREPEDVHDMRVATRRLRALLRTQRRMFDRAWAEGLRAELDVLAERLGAVRDADVLLARLDSEAAELDRGDVISAGHLLEALRERRAGALAELQAMLGDDRYYRLLERLDRADAALPVRNAKLSIDRGARKEFTRLRRSGRTLRRGISDGELHKLRIRAKRARYAAEVVAPAVGKPAKRFVKRAKAFQDLLGEHQDAVMAEQTLRRLAAHMPDHASSLAAGRIVERERSRRRRARKQLPRSWKQLRRAGTKAWA